MPIWPGYDLPELPLLLHQCDVECSSDHVCNKLCIWTIPLHVLVSSWNLTLDYTSPVSCSSESQQQEYLPLDPNRAMPGKQMWPNFRGVLTTSPEDRESMRETVLRMWRDEADYKAMAYLRANEPGSAASAKGGHSSDPALVAYNVEACLGAAL